MYGFEAISMHNGWAMAAAGALIVFSGLVILSTVISQLHKVLDFFENLVNRFKVKSAAISDEETSDQSASKPAASKPASQKPAKAERFLDDLDMVVNRYKSASEPLGDTFPLAELYRLAREIDAPHPHLTISHLRQHHFLNPQGNGLFSWR